MIKFELLSEKNINAVYELEKTCFDDPWTYSMFESELKNDFSVFVVGVDEDDGSVVGYGGVWLMYDFGDVTNIAVRYDCRREGIGGKILDMLIDVCREKGLEKVCLEVREDNIPAMEMYTAFGFKRDGIRKRYYQNKYDAHLMSYDLRNAEEEK